MKNCTFSLQKATSRLIMLMLAIFFSACSSKSEPPTGSLIVTEKLNFTIDTLATGLTNPWSMAFLPDGRILIAERPGNLRIWEKGKLLDKPVEGLTEIWSHGQGGLLDVVLHPDYEQNGWIYLAYAKSIGEVGSTALGRGKLDGDQIVNFEELFHGSELTDAPYHFGCRIVFDDNNYLYFCIGDRGVMSNAQKLTNHNGKVHRIHDDGRIPVDNPFVDSAGAMPEIWTYGNRNIQGMALHPQTKDLWSHEHGARGGDEINLMKKGGNYGWPLVTFGINYDGTQITPDTTLPGMIDPILHWTPSIAPCGMTFVDSPKYPGWNGNMLVGALAGQHIHRVEFEGNKAVHTEMLLEGFARFRDIRQGPDGYIYVLTETPGIFFRIIPNN
ncbi:MAG: PQQ-dependent sugar dehydrogenase [Bacteroidales bacterium]|nr:PQQ-dependent sugar dehydrogenase [Bacteroidales bacterium]